MPGCFSLGGFLLAKSPPWTNSMGVAASGRCGDGARRLHRYRLGNWLFGRACLCASLLKQSPELQVVRCEEANAVLFAIALLGLFALVFGLYQDITLTRCEAGTFFCRSWLVRPCLQVVHPQKPPGLGLVLCLPSTPGCHWRPAGLGESDWN